MQIKTIFAILAFTGATGAAPVEATTDLHLWMKDSAMNMSVEETQSLIPREEYNRERDVTADQEGRFSYEYKGEEGAAAKPDGSFSYEYRN